MNTILLYHFPHTLFIFPYYLQLVTIIIYHLQPTTFGIKLVNIVRNSTLTFDKNDKNKQSLEYCQFRTCLQSYNVATKEVLFERPSFDDDDGSSTTYSKLNYQWNNCCSKPVYPIAYFLPNSSFQVQVAIKCANSVGNLRIVPKGGGHSFGSYSFGDSINTIVIDLQNMNQISIDLTNKTAQVGPGVLLGPLIYKLWNQDKFTLPVGSCMSVGIAGFVLGGGYSEFSRLYGIASDSLLSATMINATGHELIVSNDQNSDLFWALRGAGLGSFGIVTDFKFKLHNAPYRIIEGKQEYTLDHFPEVFEAWQIFMATNPSNTLNAVLRTRPTDNLIRLKVIELQTKEEFVEFGSRNVELVLDRFPISQNSRLISDWAYLDFIVHAGMEDMGGPANVSVKSPDDLQHVSRADFRPSTGVRAKTFYVNTTIGENDIRILFELLKSTPPNILIGLKGLGGAINNFQPTETGFVHRNHYYEFDIFYTVTWDTWEQTSIDALEWINNLFSTTKIMMNHTESYQNHLDVEMSDYLQRHYGENLEKLVQVKRKYDEHNFFYNPQSIPTSMP